MKGFLIRGWDLIPTGWPWLYESRLGFSSQWGWGFHTVRGGIDPGDHHFRPRVVGVVDVWRDF